MAQHFQAAIVGSSPAAFDYSDHFNLLNDLVERMAIAVESIAANQILIESHLDKIQSTVDNTTSSCATGPHMRVLGGGCANEAELTRALMMTNMKKTSMLEEVRAEINNPTAFP